jgi:hypothetical protein
MGAHMKAKINSSFNINNIYECRKTKMLFSDRWSS